MTALRPAPWTATRHSATGAFLFVAHTPRSVAAAPRLRHGSGKPAHPLVYSGCEHDRVSRLRPTETGPNQISQVSPVYAAGLQPQRAAVATIPRRKACATCKGGSKKIGTRNVRRLHSARAAAISRNARPEPSQQNSTPGTRALHVARLTRRVFQVRTIHNRTRGCLISRGTFWNALPRLGTF